MDKKRKEGGGIGIANFSKNPKNCDEVHIAFINVPDPKETVINYIILKGFSEGGDNKKSTTKIKNVSKDDE